MTPPHPAAGPDPAAAGLAEPASPLEAYLREVFLGWERLRLVYNAVLAGLCGLGGLPHLFGGEAGDVLGYLAACVICGLAANLCYLAGPAVEAYVGVLGYRAGWVRVVVFAAGLLFSLAVTLLAVAATWVPGF